LIRFLRHSQIDRVLAIGLGVGYATILVGQGLAVAAGVLPPDVALFVGPLGGRGVQSA